MTQSWSCFEAGRPFKRRAKNPAKRVFYEMELYTIAQVRVYHLPTEIYEYSPEACIWADEVVIGCEVVGLLEDIGGDHSSASKLVIDAANLFYAAVKRECTADQCGAVEYVVAELMACGPEIL